MLSRRAALAGLTLSFAPAPLLWADGLPAFVSAGRLPNGVHAAVVLSADGDVLHTECLSGRGHDAAIRHDPPTAVVFARRPGRFAVVVDLARLTRTAVFGPPADRRFAGHGFFSRDGRILFATENDFEAERGVLGLYDATDNYRRLGEFDTHGIGPHEALLLSDGRTIAVANGGIATHPDFPRMKLNLPTMAPSLALLDAQDGALRGHAQLPARDHQLSIRHMAETRDGEIWFGAQFDGPRSQTPPLVGVFGRDEGLHLIEESAEHTRNLSHYVGSVAASGDGTQVVTTSPRGNRALVWDRRTRSVIKTVPLADVCGAAPAAAGFALTTGGGSFRGSGGAEETVAFAFDNHLRAI